LVDKNPSSLLYRVTGQLAGKTRRIHSIKKHKHLLNYVYEYNFYMWLNIHGIFSGGGEKQGTMLFSNHEELETTN